LRAHGFFKSGCGVEGATQFTVPSAGAPEGRDVLQRRARGDVHSSCTSKFGLRGQGSSFRTQGSGFRAQGSGLRAQGSGFRVQGSGFRVQGSGFGSTE